MALNLIRLHNICQDRDLLLSTLRDWKLIPVEGTYICPKCGNGRLTLVHCSARGDGWRWKCYNSVTERKQKAKKCDAFVEFRHGTFFAGSKLEIFQILGFVNLWVSNASLKLIGEQLELAGQTAVDWSSFCREVLVDAFLSNKEKLGGPGRIVEIDESKFGKRKYHRGHRVDGQWVFGGYERETGRVFMVTVDTRGADALIPVIEEWIEPGTTIYSDYWRAYDCLDRHGYQHLKVNHSLNFKDPETGVHTNAIESSWRAAKAIVTSAGRKKAHIPGNLARYMFYKRCDQLNLNRSVEFFRLAGQLYNPCDNICKAPSDEEKHDGDDDDREDLDDSALF